MNNIRITVRLFAGPKELLQRELVEVDLALPCKVADLKHSLATEYDSIRDFVRYGRIAIGNDFASDQMELGPNLANQTVALIPPVSGG
jgi:molybdopterin converting factor small subunit